MRAIRCQLRGFSRLAAVVSALLLGCALPAAAQGTGSAVQIFGPKQYVRTTGAPNQYTDTLAVPAWVVSPYNLHIQNGDPSGSNRVSSATITVNGVQVAGPSDFNQNVASLDRSVTLTAQTTLHVTLASKPGSYLILNLGGASGDHTAPVLAIAAPANGHAVNTATPYIDVTYSDPVGAGETAASGVNPATLKVTLDGTDQTALFTRRSGDASATLPGSLALAPGTHTLTASVSDNAGNAATATSRFTVDLTAPQIQVVAPAAGSYLATATPALHVTYGDNTAVDLSTLQIRINGVDRTALFTRTATDATATLTADTALPQGANQITAQIRDTAGNPASDAAAFNVDLTPPVVTIVGPAANARFGSGDVPIAITYSDDQAIDPTTLRVRLDGNLIGVTAGPDGATGTATGVADGSHTLTARIQDKAGHPVSASVTFVVDTAAPTIQLVAPAPGAFVKTASPPITIAYSDPDAVNPATFKVLVNGADVTNLFTAGANQATAVLEGHLTLPDGTVTVTAQINNLAGITGSTTSTFTVDTTPPTVSVTAPAGAVNSGNPAAAATYADGGSGIDVASIHILLDGAEATSYFALTAEKAVGTLQTDPPLADGTHTLQVTVADRAGNPATATATFVVDTTPPVATFAAPADNAFLNDSTPAITLSYDDGTGSGVDPATVQVFLAKGSDPESEITGLFSVGAQKATGEIPAASSLADATWHLRATLRDRAGNTVTARATFELDTVAPTYQIVQPGESSALNVTTPPIVIAYQDDRSGVDTAKLALRIDGVDKSALLTAGADQATATLQAADALADGTHTIEVTVVDRAGNAAPVAPRTFVVDTVPPTIQAALAPAPNAAGWNDSDVTITYTCDDGGSGVATCPAPQTVSTEGANQQVSATVTDSAGNSAAASVTVNLDKTPPTITASLSPAPNGNGWNSTDVTVTFTCADTLSGVAHCPDPVVVSTPGAGQVISGTATDVAGNTASASVTVNLSKQPPAIAAAVSPTPNTAGWNDTDVTVTFTCTAGGAPVASCPSPQVVSTEGADQQVTATVTDDAGATASATATVSLDKTPPVITATAAPAPNAAGWSTGAVTVTFTCTDALSGIADCPAPVTVSAQGTQTVSGTATDKAGNTATASVTVQLETSPPTIAAQAAPPPNAAGWNNTDVTITYVCTPSASPVTSCPPPRTVSTEGAAQVFTATAQDAAGNQATASVTLSLDKTAPAIAQLDAPAELPPGGSGTVSVTATDNVSIAAVAFQVDGTTAATVTAPPYQFTLAVPATAKVGDTLTVTALVTDEAGNTATSSKGVKIAAQGVVVGQVLSDLTGLPLPGAVVQVVGGTRQDVSDDAGRYSLPVDSNHLFLAIAKPADASAPATLTVEREVNVQASVGTVPVDARLTPLAAAVAIGAAGGTLTAGNLSVAVAAGDVAEATPFHLTPLSGQGLPGLLPLGWSPVVAFDLRADAATAAQFDADFTGLPKSQPLQLVTYNPGVHAWTLVEPDLTSADGTLTVVLPATGSYALVIADLTDPPLEVPGSGQPLPGASMVPLPADAVSSGALSPTSLSPAGGTAMATLTVQSSVALPSGTVVQADVTESYSLTSGDQISEPSRSEDLVLYRYQAPAGSKVAATFPVTPSHTFQVAELQTGKVHLDILAGRESVRGETGGSSAVVVQAGDASLAVAAGSLAQDTAVALTPEALASFLPTGNGLTPLAQYQIDFSGETLTLPAQLADDAGAAQPGDTLLLARIQRVGGVPRLVVVSLAQVSGTQIVSQPYPGLPGIVQGGEYVFYRSAQPLGFVSGRVTASGAPVSALVQTDPLPFVALADAAGQYTLPAVPGTANLKATVPQTALLGTGSVAVTAGQTASLDLALSGAVSAATVNPPDGALGVDPTAGITILSPDALSPATVTAANVQLFQVAASGNQPVAVRFVLSQGGRQLSVFPLAALQPATRYTLQVSGLVSTLGGVVTVPSVTFTTKAVTPPNFNPDALVFAFPDSEGNVALNAPANSFPPGSNVLIVDETNGVVLSLTVRNDGSVSGQIPATIDDVLLVTVTAPDKSTTSFTRTQFVAPDGTVAVGSNGGIVTGPGGVELRIPEGALDHAVRLKIEAFGPDRFPERPDVPDGQFGSGLKVSSPDKLVFKKELKLAFPKPADAPDGSFFYAYRRLATADNTVAFEVIDHAFVEGQGDQAKVVTASAPFPGFISGMAALASNPATAGLASSFEDNYFYLMWSYESVLVGVASQGVIVGKVRRVVPPGPGQTDPTYVGIAGAKVYLSDDDQLAGGASQPGGMAVSQADGTFSIWDRKLGGGTRKVTAVYGSETVEATAFEVDAAQADPVFFPNVQIFKYYRNVGKVSIAFPPLSPPPPAPQVDVRLFTLDSNGLRVPAAGVLQTGTPLVIAFKSPLVVKGATVGGAPQNVTAPDVPDNPQDPLRFDSRVVGTYTVGPPGVYTIVATALPALGGPAVTSTRSFLAVAAGGGNGSPTPGVAPTVVATSPLDHAEGIAATAFPQVTFSEPVTQVPGNVMLADSSGHATDLRLIGIRPDGSVANPVGSGDAVTALTLQPTTGLKFGETYTLTLGSGIADLNQPPLHLAPFTLNFKTFGPQELGGTAPFSSTRPVVLGQRAYVGKIVNSSLSSLDIVDISDPANPAEIGSPAYFVGRAIDIAGVAASPVTRGPLVAVAAGIGPLPLPSNVWIYDVSNPDAPSRVAAVSATTSAGQDGTLLRIAMKGGLIYASTFPKGIQVIDVQQAVTDYQDHSGIDFGQAITTEGQGFATDAVVNTIPLTTGQGSIATMYDLEAADFATQPPDPNDPSAPVPTQTLVVATGRLPLVVADPEQAGPSAVLYPPRDSGGTGLSAVPFQSANGQFRLELGHALVLGSLQRTDEAGNSNSLPVALVVGTGTVGAATGVPLLAVIDLTDVHHPAPLGFMQLPEFAGDIALKDSVALIASGGKIRLVSLTDPAHPSDAGEIDGSFGDRLALSDSGILVSSSLNGAVGGIHTAALNIVAQITRLTPQISLDATGKTTEPIEVEYQFVGNTETLASGILDIEEDGEVIGSFTVHDVSPGKHTVTIPAGLQLNPSPKTVEVSVVRPDGTTTTPFVTRLDALDSDEPTAEPVTTASTSLKDNSVGTAEAVSLKSDFVPLDSLSPTQVSLGAADTTFTAVGFGVGDLPTVSIEDLDGNFTDLGATKITDDSVTFTVPGAFFSRAGFLNISPTGPSSIGTLVPVADPALPALNTSSDIVASFLDTAQADAAGNTLLTVAGNHFEDGMTLVLGRGDLPTAKLPTTLTSTGSLQAVLPVWAQVQDETVFVAVLSVDGRTLSNPLRMPVALPSDAVEPSEPLDLDYPLDAAAAFSLGDIEVTGAQRNPTSGNPDLEPLRQIELQGVGLTEGAVVQFKTLRAGRVVIENSVLTSVSDVPTTSAALASPTKETTSQKPKLKRGNASLPPKAQKRGSRTVTIKGVATDGQVVAESRPQNANVGALFIPFGGRVKVGIYEDSKDPNKKLSVMTPLEHDALANAADLVLRTDLTPAFQNQDTGRPLAQIEKESGTSEAGYYHLRGLSLSQVPGDSDSTRRPTGKILVNNKSLRDVYVFYINFGTDVVQNDQEIARAANRHGLPPQFLKAQALQESQRFSKNFRYEPSTIDFNQLSGDAGRNVIDQTPFRFYAIPGTYLGTIPAKTDLPPFQYSTPNQKAFSLGIAPIKRRNGGVIFGNSKKGIADLSWHPPGSRNELQPAVFAQIEQQGVAPQRLTLIRSQKVWRKVGTGAAGYPQGVVEPVPNPTLNAGEFSVDYDNGTITLGAPLQPGQSLHVTRFWPLSGLAKPVNQGQFVPSAPDLNSSAVKQQINIRYDVAHQQTLSGFFTSNIATFPSGNFLSGTASDRQIEFRVNAQDMPVTPLDPKYQLATAQPYAAASYGVLQLTLGAWTDPKRRVLDNIFNIRFQERPNFRSVFDLLSAVDPTTHTTKDQNGIEVAVKNGLELGAAYTDTSYSQAQARQQLLCSSSNCSNDSWQKQWALIFSLYNPAESFYVLGKNGLNVLAQQSLRYAPR